MEEEYNSEIWPKLKQDVVDIMELGSYHSLSIRADWSLAQINFFYQNCRKYRLDPSLEDDDVASEDGGMAAEMRSEGDVVEARTSDMGGALFNDDISNWVFNNSSCSNGTGIIMGWDPNSIRVMVISQFAQVMSLFVDSVNGQHRFFCSFIYAHVRASGRKDLWKELGCYSLRRFGSGVHGNQFQQKSSSFGRNKGVNGMSSGKNNFGKKAPVQEIKKKTLVEKPVLASSYNHNFRPKVLDKEECVLEDMEEEYNSEIWPKLKQDVVDIMELGSYHSLSIRADWSLAQINFFYQNCRKYRLDPSLEDDDVASEDGGMAAEMRSEGDVVEARTSDMGGALFNDDISNLGWVFCFTSGMVDFRDCLGVIGVEDLIMSGLRYTWNKSPGCTNGLLKKLDRVMCNGHFVEKFVNSNAQFLPFVASDHTPVVIEIPIPGHAMFSVVSKLMLLKKPLRKLKLAQGDLAKRVYDLRHELEKVQTLMVEDSFNADLRKKEMECLIAYKDALKDEESMLNQRAKVDWLSEGDANTKFFHKTVKGNLNRNRIAYVDDMNVVKFSGQHVGAQLKLTHMSFADDLMVFAKADVHSVMILSKALKEFSGVSGLVPNLSKSSVFFCNVHESLKSEILHVLPFTVGCLPVRPINRSIWSILQRLVIGSMVYFIWLERNMRRFQDKRRPVKDFCGIIRDNMRLRLMSLKIKKSVQVKEATRH
nr:hypothetical protein [Tanacetum cinerariifolium]